MGNGLSFEGIEMLPVTMPFVVAVEWIMRKTIVPAEGASYSE